jgi:Family of unknown function (DUF6152)
MKLKALCIFIVGSVFLAMPALAHHSHGNYDTTTWTPFEGVVKELHLVSPHSFVYLEVKDDKGQPVTWLLEATNPRGLEGKGIKRDSRKGRGIVSRYIEQKRLEEARKSEGCCHCSADEDQPKTLAHEQAEYLGGLSAARIFLMIIVRLFAFLPGSLSLRCPEPV